MTLEGSEAYCYGEDKGEGNMSIPVNELFRQASELDEHDRATLAGLLLESLEHEVDENIESAWQEEIERRLAELDADRVKLVPWDEVKAKLVRRTGAERQD
jgi:putative addiction module component (TIGR02574 family)